MHQLWAVRVDGGNGKELYGEDYADIYAINRLHFKATTNGTCDHVRNRLKWSRGVHLGCKRSVELVHENVVNLFQVIRRTVTNTWC